MGPHHWKPMDLRPWHHRTNIVVVKVVAATTLHHRRLELGLVPKELASIPSMGRPSHHGSHHYHGKGDLGRSGQRPAPPSAAWAGCAIWGRDAERRMNVGRYAEDGRRRSPLPWQMGSATGEASLGVGRGGHATVILGRRGLCQSGEGAGRGNQLGQGVSRQNQWGWAGQR